MEGLKKNYPVIVAILLPVILILGIYISARTPLTPVETNYNFVYATCDDDGRYYSYNCHNYLESLYDVEDGRLVVQEVSADQDSDGDNIKDIDENYEPRLFLHNTMTNESREMSLDEIQTLVLDDKVTSPDGVAVESIYNRGPDFFLIFDGGSSYGYYLTKGKSRSKLNLIGDTDRYYYDNNFEFIGWIAR